MVTTLCLLVCGVVLEPLSYHDNFLTNSTCAVDRNRDEQPDGWSAMAFASAGMFAWERKLGHEDTASLRLRDPGPAAENHDWKQSTVRWMSDEYPVEPTTEYGLTAWAKTSKTTGRARVILSWLNAGHYLDQAASATVTGSSDWSQLHVDAKAPPTATGVRVILELSDGTGTAWFDDIKLSGKSQRQPEYPYVFHDTANWFPFEFPGTDTNRDTIDLSRFLDAPAGKHGFLTVRADGHFYFADGKRARFFGTNLGGADIAPAKDVARVLAKRFAKYGVNMARLHSLDGQSTKLIDYSTGTSQSFNATVLDRMDYLIAQFKAEGIYVYLDLLDYRMFRSADGVAHGDEFTHNWAGSMKGASVFDPRMIELQKDYATKLLTHRNPYTGLRYVDEPAIAVLETTNENSVFYFLLNGELSLSYYRDQLQSRWNQWLRRHYRDRAELASAWTDENGDVEILSDEDPQQTTVQLPAAELSRFSRGAMPDRLKYRMGPKRMHDVLQFLGAIQHDYNMALRNHLKKTVGVKIPVTGTNQTFIVCDTYVNATTSDFISRNQYWRHPSRNAKPFFKFANEPMVHTDLPHYRTPFSVFGGSAIVGKPMMLTEFNFPWPNEYRCEGLLLCSAYSCLQDWDAVLLFSFGIGRPELAMFRSHSDPARWGDFPAAALLFHRADVAVGHNAIHVVNAAQQIHQLQPDQRYSPYSSFRFLTYMSKVRRGFAQGTYTHHTDAVLACGPDADVAVAPGQPAIRIAKDPWSTSVYPEFITQARRLGLPGYDQIDPQQPQFDSDTGELSLNYGKGVFLVDTQRTKGAIGLLQQAGELSLGNVSIECTNEFAAIMVQSLDDQPIGASSRLLVTAVARAENTAQGFWPNPPNPKSWSPFMTWMLPATGRLPVIAEPVRARLRVPAPPHAVVFALDATGKRQSRLAASHRGQQIEFDLAPVRSIWCEITPEPPRGQ